MLTTIVRSGWGMKASMVTWMLFLMCDIDPALTLTGFVSSELGAAPLQMAKALAPTR